MIEDNKYQIINEDDYLIDFGKIFKDIWKHKKLYLITLPLAFSLAAIYALSIPNYYRCIVKLSPEMANRAYATPFTVLANSLSSGIGGSALTTEALIPALYPDLMNSVDFKTSLFPIKISRNGVKESMSYYEYLAYEQKQPWWSEAVSKLYGLFNNNTIIHDSIVNPFRLTGRQAKIIKRINQNVTCTVDKRSSTIVIKVTDQDPQVAAVIADSVRTRLQDFITEYRTSKAKVDLAYNQKIYVEAKLRYDEATRRYAEFADANRDIIRETTKQKMAELENEMQLHFNMYQQIATQLQKTEMKVQEEVPAFTTLQSATIPVEKAGPVRGKMCLIFTFLVFLATTCWVFYKEDDFRNIARAL